MSRFGVSKRWSKDDFRKYIDMGIGGTSRVDIVSVMTKDLGVTEGNAKGLYNKWVKNAVEYYLSVHKGIQNGSVGG